MKQTKTIWVVGGDLRQCCLARLLAEAGHRVHTLALERGELPPGVIPEETPAFIERADCVILPLPAVDGAGNLTAPLSGERYLLEDLLDLLHPGQILCGGQIGPETQRGAERRGLYIHDYFAREELAVANAVPTAEGAIQIAMEQLPITLQEARVLILGYGRLGKVLTQRFRALGAETWAAARKCADLAWIRADGARPVPMGRLGQVLDRFDLVVNTAPAPILRREQLSRLRPDSLVIDLASRPGGVDQNAAGELGVRVIWALALPGKVAPVTAARGIRDAVFHILEELGV